MEHVFLLFLLVLPTMSCETIARNNSDTNTTESLKNYVETTTTMDNQTKTGPVLVEKPKEDLNFVNFNSSCRTFAYNCPPVTSPLCVKIRYNTDGFKNKTVYVLMINKCEMDYLNKCYEGISATEIPMNFCDVEGKEVRQQKNRVKRGTKVDDLRDIALRELLGIKKDDITKNNTQKNYITDEKDEGKSESLRKNQYENFKIDGKTICRLKMCPEGYYCKIGKGCVKDSRELNEPESTDEDMSEESPDGGKKNMYLGKDIPKANKSERCRKKCPKGYYCKKGKGCVKDSKKLPETEPNDKNEDIKTKCRIKCPKGYYCKKGKGCVKDSKELPEPESNDEKENKPERCRMKCPKGYYCKKGKGCVKVSIELPEPESNDENEDIKTECRVKCPKGYYCKKGKGCVKYNVAKCKKRCPKGYYCKLGSCVNDSRELPEPDSNDEDTSKESPDGGGKKTMSMMMKDENPAHDKEWSKKDQEKIHKMREFGYKTYRGCLDKNGKKDECGKPPKEEQFNWDANENPYRDDQDENDGADANDGKGSSDKPLTFWLTPEPSVEDSDSEYKFQPATRESVDMEQYNADCPKECPSRDVIVCGVCKDGVHRSFLSICHMRMFNCKYPKEKIRLVSREACTQLSPYDEDLETIRGRVMEPQNDDDRVLRYLRCKEWLNNPLSRIKDDPRCHGIKTGYYKLKPKDES